MLDQQRTRLPRPAASSTVVIAAVEDSDGGWRAMSYAAGLARRIDATLVLVHVRVPPRLVWFETTGTPMVGPSLVDPQAGEDFLERLAAAARRDHEIAVEALLLQGAAVEEVARLADELQADSVIVGAPRRRRLRGGFAGRLMRRGHWLVTAVP